MKLLNNKSFNMNKNATSIYRPKTVCEIFDCSSSTLFRMVKAGLIKPPIKLGSRSVGFPKSEIEAFLLIRMEERDNEQESKLTNPTE